METWWYVGQNSPCSLKELGYETFLWKFYTKFLFLIIGVYFIQFNSIGSMSHMFHVSHQVYISQFFLHVVFTKYLKISLSKYSLYMWKNKAKHMD